MTVRPNSLQAVLERQATQPIQHTPESAAAPAAPDRGRPEPTAPQVKAEKFAARAYTADREERAALWPMMVQIYGPYTQYQTKTDRQIPVVVLKPT